MAPCRIFVCSLLVLLTACDGATPVDAGDGFPDASLAADAGRDAGPGDAGPEPSDAGADAGPPDAGPPDAGPPDAGPPLACDPALLTVDGFLDGYRDGLCSLYARCGTYLSSDQRAFCHTGIWDEAAREVRDGLVSGELVLDADIACGCLDAIERPTCDTFWIGLFSCVGAWRHAVTPTDCADALDCDQDQTCVRDGMCPGRCEDLPTLGEPCELVCTPGLTCGDESGRCEALGALGEPCGLGDRCDSALYCDDGTCRGPAAAGEPCGGGAYCEAGLVCTEGICGAGRGDGEPCDRRDRCALGLRCDDDDVCVRALIAGDACARDDECPASHRCDGVCVERPLVGEACPDDDCYLGTCVDGVCAPSPDGAACAPSVFFLDAQCEGYCDYTSDTCQAQIPEGEVCTNPYACEAGLECDLADTGTCVPACEP